MKKILQLILIAVLALAGPFDAFSGCFGPNHQFRFHKTLDRMTVANSEQSKLRIGMVFVENNCFTTNQLIQMLGYYRHDADKVVLSKKAFRLVSDPEHFNLVFHQIAIPGHRRELRAFVQLQRHGRRINRLNFPSIDYPNAYNYRGRLGAADFINDRLFTDLAFNVLHARTDKDKFDLVNKYARQYELNVEQFMKMLTLVEVPSDRLDLAIENHQFLYDQGNVRFIENVFYNSFFANQFRKALRPTFRHQGVAHAPRYGRNREHVDPRGDRMRMEPRRQEMDQIIFTLRNEPFSGKRLLLA